MELPNTAPSGDELRHADVQRMVEVLRSQKARRLDIVCRADTLAMTHDKATIIVPVPATTGSGTLDETLAGLGVSPSSRGETTHVSLNPVSTRQLGTRLSIPAKYYDLLASTNVPLLARNVNERLSGPGGIASESLMLRMFTGDDGQDGILRAVLSDRYKALDNLDVLFSALRAMTGVDVEIGRCSLTDRKMYVEVRAPSVFVDAAPLMRHYQHPITRDRDARLMAGLVISNSEVGHGAFEVASRPYANVCFNTFAAPLGDKAYRRLHVGGRLEEGIVNWSGDTRQKAFELAELQVADAVKTFLSVGYLQSINERLRPFAEQELAHPQSAIVNTARMIGLTEAEENDLVRFFVRSGDTSALGLVQATTFLAQQVPSADRQYALEADVWGVLDDLKRVDSETTIRRSGAGELATLN